MESSGRRAPGAPPAILLLGSLVSFQAIALSVLIPQTVLALRGSHIAAKGWQSRDRGQGISAKGSQARDLSQETSAKGSQLSDLSPFVPNTVWGLALESCLSILSGCAYPEAKQARSGHLISFRGGRPENYFGQSTNSRVQL